MKLQGTFHSTCPEHPPDYCLGEIELDLESDLHSSPEYVKGTLSLEYTGTFRPKMPFPAKLPPLPIEARRQPDGGYKIGIRTTWYKFWERILLTIGLSVKVRPIRDFGNISADYYVDGIRGFFGVAAIERDYGVCKVRAI